MEIEELAGDVDDDCTQSGCRDSNSGALALCEAVAESGEANDTRHSGGSLLVEVRAAEARAVRSPPPTAASAVAVAVAAVAVTCILPGSLGASFPL